MKLSIRMKFLLLYIIIAIAGFVLIATVGSMAVERQQETRLVNNIYNDANYLAASYNVNTGSINQGQLQGMAYASGCDIWIIDMSGTLVAHSGTDDSAPEAVSFDSTDATEGRYLIGNFGGAFPHNVLTVFAPLTRSLQLQGYVLFHYPMQQLFDTRESILAFAYITYMVLVLAFGLFLVLLEFLVHRPLQKVLHAAREYANGNLSYPSYVSSHDEFGELSATLEEVARQLNNSGDDQHRFLANISHDFRSPLTSIRGYLVAIQDGTIPPEMQEKYINVILNETDRLTKLTSGLLDLTQLENGMLLDKTVFDINDMIRNVLATFEGRVEDKQITFQVTFESPSQMVLADRTRIQQVIYNLTDNAIKFSNPGSSIDLSTRLLKDKVYVSIKDHGVGIEKENVPKIWERFFKTDTSRGKDKKGTGLGLSIVREIIQAHRENIDVISTPEVGTEFIFTLQAEGKEDFI